MLTCAVECLHLLHIPELKKITNQIQLVLHNYYAPTHRGSVCPLVFHRGPTTYLKILPPTVPAVPESAFYVAFCWAR